MKTWRELLGGGPNLTADIDRHGDDDDKSSDGKTFVTFVTTPQESEPQDHRAFVATVTNLVGTHPEAELDAENDQEHGKSWDAWMNEQRTRIFAEARATRALASEELDTAVTTFQNSFFSELAQISADSEAELRERAGRQGILPECPRAFWRSRQRLKKAPTR